MRDYHINIFYSDDDKGYIADIPDLAACSACGFSLIILEAEHQLEEGCSFRNTPFVWLS